MKYLAASVFRILAWALSMGTAVAATVHVTLVEDAAAKQWCAFPGGDAAQAEIERLQAQSVANLFYKDSRLAEVDERSNAEDGDYWVSQHYFFDGQEVPVKLERRTNTTHGDVIAVEVYDLTSGKPHKVSTGFLDPVTHKPVSRPKYLYLYEGYPIWARLEDFPYFSLLQNPAIQTAEKTCAAEK